ncbi:TetR family transcriptional regulator [Paenibacillus nicotianae]|uniref:TetR family transcriptional regulator n=1 Tax=Paenibacillus nicotianae TaxID=1526551 RepID=A0ABW4V030_9BACL
MAYDAPLTKEQILDAAEQALRRYGPDKTSVVDVARALKVSHGTIYRHFASKAALRESVTERWLQQISLPLQHIVQDHHHSATERLRQWLETLAQTKRKYAVEDPEMFQMYTVVTMEALPSIVNHVDLLVDQVSLIIQQGIEDNEFKQGQPEQIARTLIIATSYFHHPAHAYQWNDPAVDQQFEQVWHMVLASIQAHSL